MINEEVVVNKQLNLKPYEAPEVQYIQMTKSEIFNFMDSIDWVNNTYTFNSPTISSPGYKNSFELYKDKTTNKVYRVCKDFKK